MNNQLEIYLAHVEGRLHHLPAAMRDEELREIRAHLEALEAAGVAQGLDPEAATQAALRQFGDPHKVGEALGQAWWRNHASIWVCVAMASLVWGCQRLLGSSGSDIIMSLNQLLASAVGPSSDAASTLDFLLANLAVQGWMHGAAPFLAGWLIGWIAPRRINWGIAAFYTTLALIRMLLPGVHDISWHLLGTMPIACLGAYVRTRRVDAEFA